MEKLKENVQTQAKVVNALSVALLLCEAFESQRPRQP